MWIAYGNSLQVFMCHSTNYVACDSTGERTQGEETLAFMQSRGSNIYTFTVSIIAGVAIFTPPIPVSGIDTQLTPVGSSTVPYNVSFTGTYNNYYGTYRGIVATATTGSPAVYSSVQGSIETGVGLSYNLSLLLSPNQTYSYYMIMCDPSGYTCTTPTAPISFSTSGLTGGISPPVWVAEACSWIDFSTWTGCFDNLMHDMFTPTTESLTQFNTLYQNYQYKPPFGYIKAIQNALAGINDTATSVFTLQSMPILNTYVFDPIRTGIIWVLWVAFSFIMYHRLKNIHL
jgi:hypothetical protein